MCQKNVIFVENFRASIMNRQRLAKAFREDSPIELTDEVIDMVIDSCEERVYPRKSEIVAVGMMDSNIYITAEGINRISYIHNAKEVTFGFGGEGSIFMSPLGFIKHMPAHLSLIAVIDCKMLVMPKAAFERMMEQSILFARWMFYLGMAQFSIIEFKSKAFQQPVKTRYSDILKRRDIEKYKSFKLNHPDIVNLVSDKVLASYLDIIPTHLASIKKQLMEEERGKA